MPFDMFGVPLRWQMLFLPSPWSCQSCPVAADDVVVQLQVHHNPRLCELVVRPDYKSSELCNFFYTLLSISVASKLKHKKRTHLCL